MVDPETHQDPTVLQVQWLALPDVAERLGVPLRDVRGLLSEQHLVALRTPPRSVWSVPASFLLGSEPDQAARVVPGLRGTLMQLADAGLDAQESVAWLHQQHEELGQAPITSLRAGSVRAVRRAAQALAW